ncbi:unnamed protein product [Anisakis simplex]|uniref:Thyroglobulin type-1 domain-containing protein n=1 Tax=Anisakis simplex TaxID=6269 RepID=A0A0M3KCY9_ANISI|nr:unnamed protein product [Anisakis simplex]
MGLMKYFEEILFDGTIPEGGGVQQQSQQQQFSTLRPQSESSVWPDQCVETVPLASPCRVRCRSTSAAQLVYCCTANAGDEWCSFTPTGQSVQCFKRAGQSVQCFIKQGDYQPSATSLCAEPECCFMQRPIAVASSRVKTVPHDSDFSHPPRHVFSSCGRRQSSLNVHILYLSLFQADLFAKLPQQCNLKSSWTVSTEVTVFKY